MSNKHEDRLSFGKMQFDVTLESAASKAPRDPEAPFGLAVIGDFSGRANRHAVEPISQRRPWRIDCDNFEEVLGKLAPRLRLPLSRTPGELTEFCFKRMDDFHPDQLVRQTAPLAALYEQRNRLLHPATTAAAAIELQALLDNPPTPMPPQAPAPAPAVAESNADTLARLLGGTPPRLASPPAEQSGAGLESMIRKIVAPSVVASVSPQQTALLSRVELELADRLRSILHHPHFQAIEAAWRGIDRLVRTFGAEENLKLFLIDVSKEELIADLRAQEEADSSGLGQLIRRQADDQPWAVGLGLYTFGDDPGDIELLGCLAKVCAQARLPFLAGASPHMVGCDSFGLHSDPDDWKQPMPADVRAAWQALRELPEAGYVGLALPRFLLRQPYGKDSDPIESFPFEELPGDPPHEDYLWGNPVILGGYLLAAAFQTEGWEMQTSGYGEVGDLPIHKFRQDGEVMVKPCAEAWLSDRACEAISKQGLTPVLSIKGRDMVRLAGLQSLAGKSFAIK